MATRALSTSDHDSLLKRNNEDHKMKTISVSLLFVVIIMAVIIIILSVQGTNGEWPFSSQKTSISETRNYREMFSFSWAPFTPTNNDESVSINYSAISYLAATGNRFGANTLFIGGSNAQFDTMSVDERKQLLSIWMNCTIENEYDFKIIFDVSSTRLFESIELAQYAAELHSKYELYDIAFGIASLPPFWERPSISDDFEQLMQWFRPIVDAAPGIEFWYNHLPKETSVDFNLNEFVDVALNGNMYGSSLTQLKGTQYVESTNPMDIFTTTNTFYDEFHFVISSKPQIAFASYSRAYGFDTDYYSIPVTKCILKAIENNEYDEVYQLQQWQNDLDAIIGDDVQKRCLHQTISGVDMGPPRQPLISINQSICDQILHELQEAQYFDEMQRQIQDC